MLLVPPNNHRRILRLIHLLRIILPGSIVPSSFLLIFNTARCGSLPLIQALAILVVTIAPITIAIIIPIIVFIVISIIVATTAIIVVMGGPRALNRSNGST